MKASEFCIAVCCFGAFLLFPVIAHRYEGKHGKDTLQLVHVIFRHGDRTNEEFVIYPKDPYKNETYYPYGHGQLTHEGKRQMYNLGKKLRVRYNDFLGDVYIPSNVESWTSDTDRTKASLLAVLAGLFPPKLDDSLEDNLTWQPIPYNHYPSAEDKLFNGALSADFRKAYGEFIRGSPATIREFQQHKDLFKFLSEQTGWNITNYERIYYLYLCLKTEEDWGLDLPKWTTQVWPKAIEQIVQKQYFSATTTPILRQITSGYLLQKLTEDTLSKLHGDPGKKERKIHLYSGHDFTLAFLLSTLDILKPHIPPYGSCLIFEVHKIDGRYGIRILYQDDETRDNPQVLKLPGCDKFCELDRFISIAQPYFLRQNYKINVIKV